MYTLALGILLVLLKYLEVSPVVNWSWWWVLSPFAVTAAWWAWADASGYSKRKAMEKWTSASRTASTARRKPWDAASAAEPLRMD